MNISPPTDESYLSLHEIPPSIRDDLLQCLREDDNRTGAGLDPDRWAVLRAHVATMPFDVLRGMIEHHKTVEGMKAFTADIVPEYSELFE